MPRSSTGIAAYSEDNDKSLTSRSRIGLDLQIFYFRFRGKSRDLQDAKQERSI